MDLIPIGEAAERLGMPTSTLRYYDQRGLVRPAARVHGTRVYGLPEMRRLAFLRLAQRLGIRLDTAGAVLDGASEQWRATVAGQIAELEELISTAEGARTFLTHTLACPAEHPVPECPYAVDVLDRLVHGTPLEQIAGEHADAGGKESGPRPEP